ncbi:MAG: VWA domain-containing protein [Bryobacteraceae bacterium]|jgi:VWFA-related protein
MWKISAFLLLCGAAPGQQPAAPPSDETVFSVTTTLVQIDAEVTDSKGNHVTNLKPEDFEVYLDKKPQAITNLSYVNLDSPNANQNAMSESGPDGAGRVLRPEDVRRSMVLLVDDLTLSFQSLHFVRRTLRNFVEHQMQPGDLVALWQTGHSDGVFQQLTSDKHVLEAAINSLHWNIRQQNLTNQTPLLPLATLDVLLDELRDTGGRKEVVYFSDGIKGLSTLYTIDPRAIDLVQGLMDKANRAGAVIDMVDAQGLIGEGQMARALYTPQYWMQQFADRTGGVAMLNSNDYFGTMQKVEDDQKGYYLIGFRAPEGLANQEDQKKIVAYSIRVKVKVKGLQVRTRAGFLGKTDEADRPKPNTPAMQLARAAFSLYSAAGIRMRLTPEFTLTTDGSPVVHNLLYLDLRDVTFHPGADGKSQADLDLYITAQAYESDQVSRSKHLVIDGTSDQVKEFQEKGAVLAMDVPVKHSGPYQIRASVRDGSSGILGSSGQYLEIPDLKKDHLIVTTPQIAETPAPTSDVSQALREFHSGSQVSFGFLISTDEGQKTMAPGALEAHVELYRDNKPILNTPVNVVPVTGESARAVKGVLKLNGAVSPGQYYLKATVVDTSDKRPYTATASTDFQVVP